MPPKKRKGSSKASQAIEVLCSICDEVIDDNSQESIFCECLCNAWVHRKCVGLSKARFDLLDSSNKPFHCLHCQFDSISSDLSSLIKSELSTLQDKVVALSNKLKEVVPSSSVSPGANNPTTLTVSQTTPSRSSEIAGSRTVSRASPRKERKFNVVFSGLAECPSGTPRSTRLSQDLDKVKDVLSNHCNLPSSCHQIRDCLRLGRYNSERSYPRPLLVTFSRVFDVQAVLSKRGSLSDSIAVKPDLSAEERAIEGILLRERWALIQSGVQKNSIKIRNSGLFVDGTLHGSVTGSSFVRSTNGGTDDQSSTNLPTGSSNNNHLNHIGGEGSGLSAASSPSSQSDD